MPRLGCILLALAATTVALPEFAWSEEVRIGIEGRYSLTYDGPKLAAKPVDDDSPIHLRIAQITSSNKGRVYDLRYIGQSAGTFDLGDYLIQSDGQPRGELPDMSVSIRESLPADHNGELEEIPDPGISSALPYQLLLYFAGSAWALAVVWLIVRRIGNRPKTTPIEKASPPTLADQLKPLIEAAMNGRLMPAEKARLEWLLLAHWRERLDLAGMPTVELLKRMRNHAEASSLLLRLEEWLYHRPTKDGENIAELLAPYQSSAALDVRERDAEGVPA